MAYWLLKTEPETYSYEDLVSEGVGVWDGVNNNLALKNMRAIALGDLAFIYHTGKERQIIGIAEVTRTAYPDPKLEDVKRVVVDVKAIEKIPQPVTLSQIKENNSFENFDLLRLSRLSVVPVSESHWQMILKLGNYS
jgi:predicted RNA-binding protein with PUA-like domain